MDSEEETLIVLEGDDAADFADEEILSEIEAEFGLDEEEAEVNEVPGAATEGAPAAATTSPAVASIVGFWSCFDPVTGRTKRPAGMSTSSIPIRPALLSSKNLRRAEWFCHPVPASASSVRVSRDCRRESVR